MTNPYELFSLPQVPWLESESVQERFVALAASHHPDMNPGVNTQTQFQNIVRANQILRDPVKRLGWLLDLEKTKCAAELSSRGLPTGLPDLFMSIASLQREASAFEARQAGAKSPLNKALMREESLSLKAGLDEALNRLDQHWDQCESEVRSMNSVWEHRTPETLRRISELHTEMVYIQRWRAQLREVQLRLTLSE